MNETAKPNAWLELLLTLVIPSLILMQLSEPENLGAVNALLLALAFPLGWGVRDYLIGRKFNLLAVFISAYTRFPLVRVLLFSPALMHVERIQENLDQRGNRSAFDGRLKTATWMLGGSFLFSAVMNYLLASWIVTSPAGSTAFNAELDRLTLLSYPMIALPSLLIMMAALYYLARSIRELAGMQLAEVLRH